MYVCIMSLRCLECLNTFVWKTCAVSLHCRVLFLVLWHPVWYLYFLLFLFFVPNLLAALINNKEKQPQDRRLQLLLCRNLSHTQLVCGAFVWSALFFFSIFPGLYDSFTSSCINAIRNKSRKKGIINYQQVRRQKEPEAEYRVTAESKTSFVLTRCSSDMVKTCCIESHT